MSNRRQVITWTNAYPVHRRIYTALEGVELKASKQGSCLFLITDLDHCKQHKLQIRFRIFGCVEQLYNSPSIGLFVHLFVCLFAWPSHSMEQYLVEFFVNVMEFAENIQLIRRNTLVFLFGGTLSQFGLSGDRKNLLLVLDISRVTQLLDL